MQPSENLQNNTAPEKDPGPRTRGGRNRNDWEYNHTRICDAYLKLVRGNPKKRPRITEIAKIAGLSCRTVAEHIRQLDINKIIDANPIKLQMQQILGGLSRKAAQGDSSAAKLFAQLVYKWEEKGVPPSSTGPQRITVGDAVIEF